MSLINGTITVEPEELKEQSTKLRSYLKNMRDTTEDIHTAMVEMRLSWTGEASDSFWSVYSKGYESLQEKYESYLLHINHLEIMAGVYEKAEAQATEAAESLSSGL